MTLSLSDRIKGYEDLVDQRLMLRQPVFIRVDGKAFHTFTRGCEKPFDHTLRSAMVYAMANTADKMQGFKLAYHQSDEVTFMLNNDASFETEAWFGNRVNKMVSITSSYFTGYFNLAYETNHDNMAVFDARAFSVPHNDAANVFLWRQQDWVRNSVQMLARANFSHKQCHCKSIQEMMDMLEERDIKWDNLNNFEKYGTFYTGSGNFLSNMTNYKYLSELLSTT